MSLKAQITDDMKNAMRAKDSERLSAIRLLLAAIKQREVDERIELDDTQVVAVVEKLMKQRKDSITQYENAGREDLAAKERFEAGILAAYLPTQLNPEEVAAAVAKAIADSGATGPADMGKVMGALKPLLAGRADMGEVSKAVKSALTPR